jgi:hypothetical protein
MPKSNVKYLGVIFDQSMTGKVHLEMTIVKAGKTASAISRLMPNVGGPKASSRKIMASVVNSIVLYTAPVWCQALKYKKWK